MRILIASLIILAVVLSGITGYAVSPRTTITIHDPPVTTPNPVASVVTQTAVYQSYVNVTLIDPKDGAHIARSLVVSILQNGGPGFSDTRPYLLDPGDHKAFTFYPGFDPTTSPGITVQP